MNDSNVARFFKSEMLNHFSNKTEAIIVYGSSIYGDSSGKDFDACVILNEYDEADKAFTVDLMKKIHSYFNLRVDEEIAYENKAIFCKRDCENLLQKLPFENDLISGRQKFNAFYSDFDYFNSIEARMRILLNVLTKKTTVLYGENFVNFYKVPLLNKLLEIALENYASFCHTKDDIIMSLIMHPNEEFYYKDYLGYSCKDFSYIKRCAEMYNLI